MLAPVAWAKARKPKWWVVRESYLIAVDEPDQVSRSCLAVENWQWG